MGTLTVAPWPWRPDRAPQGMLASADYRANSSIWCWCF